MLFELRIYRTRPGQRAAWVRFFEEEIVPYLHAKGIVVVGSFVSEQDEDQFVWMRRFDSEEERVRLYAAFYESHFCQPIHPPFYTTGGERVIMRTRAGRQSYAAHRRHGTAGSGSRLSVAPMAGNSAAAVGACAARRAGFASAR
jgi:hypothetical protein